VSLARIRAAAGAAALALSLGTGAVVMAAPAASAAPSISALPAGVAGTCTPLQDGEYQQRGRLVYVCMYVEGFGGFYWVEVVQGSGCGAVSASREAPAAKVC
jgi:hypothetical protein